MLKLNPNPTFKADVRITVPGEETPAVIKMEFRHMTLDAATSWYEGSTEKPVAEALAQIISGWEGIEDEHGHQTVFSQITLGTLLANYPAAASEIVSAYWRELTASRIKN